MGSQIQGCAKGRKFKVQKFVNLHGLPIGAKFDQLKFTNTTAA